MSKYNANIPNGTRDYLFDECGKRRTLENALSRMFSKHGYGEMKSPTLEYYDTFTRTGNAPFEENMYKLIDRDGRILVLRPDSTTPVARVFAAKLKHLALPQRVFYIQSVFRSGAAHTGSSAETVQAGAELIGAGGLRADLEVITLAISALEECGVEKFHIEIGHCGLFKALISELTDDTETAEEIRKTVERKNYAALGDILQPFGDTSAAAALKKLVGMFGGDEILGEARKLSSVPQAAECVEYLENLFLELKRAGYEDKIRFDMGLVQQIEYYTGIVFQGFAEGVGEAVLKGGRYDYLTSSFGAEAEAIGFGLNIDSLPGSAGETKTETPVVLHYENGCLGEALEYIKMSGVCCELSTLNSVEESRRLAGEKGAALKIVTSNGITDDIEGLL
ncbi:MAG: ATP phosphoribosyltransferase regulatory subunit [Oscillospiraceae bacterium]|jgi:ATP phosphoribosyltransferase regulatory subunit|nr:ATP phosphoribosyltransferase regulatory subunit [Oscillospiraceae bacterium]